MPKVKHGWQTASVVGTAKRAQTSCAQILRSFLCKDETDQLVYPFGLMEEESRELFLIGVAALKYGEG